MIWRQGVFRGGWRHPQGPAVLNHKRCRVRHRTCTGSFSTQSSPDSFSVDRATGQVFQQNQARFQTIVGLEIHAQLDIGTKLFSPAKVVPRLSTVPNHAPYLNPLDVAVPGYLPVLSQEAVQAAVLAAGVLQCQEIATVSRFERKHYSYADLPAHYQITQQRWPLAQRGHVEAQFFLDNNKKKKDAAQMAHCRVRRLQLEQDTGKTTASGWGSSLVDLNRAGHALLEIVLEPDLRTPRQAAAVTETIRLLLQHIQVCNGRMEEGSLRCDVNVNIEEVSTDEEESSASSEEELALLRQNQKRKRRRSPRVEVKNLNSIRQVRDAVEYEVLRQAQAWVENSSSDDENSEDSSTIHSTQPPASETRMWNPARKRTEVLRSKDLEQDYRFLPEPDLPPLHLNEAVLGFDTVKAFLQAKLPELPKEAVQRLQDAYQLSEYQATVITSDPPAIQFLDQAIATARAELATTSEEYNVLEVYKLTTNLLINELYGLVRKHAVSLMHNSNSDESRPDASVRDSLVSAKQLGQVVALLVNGTLSKGMAKKLLTAMYKPDEETAAVHPAQLAEERGWKLITDPAQVRDFCLTAIEQYPKDAQEYQDAAVNYPADKGRRKKKKLITFFSGKVMRATQGNAEPELVQDVLEQVLEERSNGRNTANDEDEN